jgi:hypothetical protein
VETGLDWNKENKVLPGIEKAFKFVKYLQKARKASKKGMGKRI